jgi:hypothetical protein
MKSDYFIFRGGGTRNEKKKKIQSLPENQDKKPMEHHEKP